MSRKPTTSEVFDLMKKLEKDPKRHLDFAELRVLKHHRTNQTKEYYLQALEDAKFVAEQRQRNNQGQPLMPKLYSSNQFCSRSPIDRRNCQKSLPDIPPKQNRSRSPFEQCNDKKSLPDNAVNRYKFCQSNKRRDVTSSLPVATEMYPTDAQCTKSRCDNRNRSVTPINDDHIVGTECDTDWNPNPLTPEKSDAINTSPLVPASKSDTQLQKSSDVAPFLMGTLKNIDNSCYMNSVLYVLRMTPTLVHSIHHLVGNLLVIFDEYGDSSEPSPSENECLQTVATSVMMANMEHWSDQLEIKCQKKLIYQLHKIFLRLTAMESRKSGNPIEKEKLQRVIHEINPIFTSGSQQDSHEFLLTVLNCIRDCGASLMKLIQDHANIFDK